MSSRAFSWTENPSDSLLPQLNSLIKPTTDEQFKSFHHIDRELYSQLIFNHGRDAIESIQVMAFWLWLERENYCPLNLVYKILLEFPPHLVPQVAEETVICLNCIENDRFFFSVSGGEEEISLLQSLMEKKKISLDQLYENRISILSKVITITNEICLRAFKDILQNAFGENSGPGNVNPDQASSSNGNRFGASTSLMPPFMGANSGSVVVNPAQASSSSSSSNGYGANISLMPRPVLGIPIHPRPLVGFTGLPTRFLTNDGSHEMITNAMGVPINHMVVPRPPNQMVVVAPPQGQNSHFIPYEHLQHHQHQREQEAEVMNNVFNPYDHLERQQGEEEIEVGNGHLNPHDFRHQQYLQQMEIVNRELEERMSNVHISEHHPEVEEVEEVPADDRTIFLTFSKGYPISEKEVREFFTRKYGDFIEAIYMQEVPSGEQSLFARIVCRRVAVIERVAPRGSKSKFAINGKHVWARKYAKKTTNSRSPS